jgi:hypothetical protein
MHHKTNVTLNLFQGLFDNVLITKSNEMLNPPAGGQHDVQIDNMTQYGHTVCFYYTSVETRDVLMKTTRGLC